MKATPSQSQARRFLILLGIMVLVALWGAGVLVEDVSSGEQDVGGILNAHELRGLDGNAFRLSDHRGEVLVINFWASWCKPCKREMPLLDAMNTRLQGTGRVVAISIDRDEKRVSRFVEENKLSLPVYVDGPEGLAADLDLEFLPYTLVLNAKGEVVFSGGVSEGASWNRLVGIVEGLTTHVSAAPASKVKS